MILFNCIFFYQVQHNVTEQQDETPAICNLKSCHWETEAGGDDCATCHQVIDLSFPQFHPSRRVSV